MYDYKKISAEDFLVRVIFTAMNTGNLGRI